MRRFQTNIASQDRTFKVQFNNNSVKDLEVKLEKQEGAPVNIDFTNLGRPLSTEVTTSETNFESKSEINNTPVEDDWYDEVIYYDGGGVDGYGD